MPEPLPARPSRRGLLKGAAGVAAGVSLLGARDLLAPAPARAAATPPPVAWPITANGYSGSIDFYKRLDPGYDNAAAWNVGGGLIANIFGNPVLVYGVGFGGITMVRPCDPEFYTFQVYRFLPTKWTQWGGPGGEFFHYTWNGTGYTKTGPFPWTTTGPCPPPWQLPRDTDPKSTYGVVDWAFHADGWTGNLREMHHFTEDSGQRNLWGKVYDESTVGYTPANLPPAGASHWFDTQGTPQPVYYYQGPYTFLRPLDTAFSSFQLYWGISRREEYYQDFAPFTFVQRRSGEAIHFDVASGAQEHFTWNTDTYPQ